MRQATRSDDHRPQPRLPLRPWQVAPLLLVASIALSCQGDINSAAPLGGSPGVGTPGSNTEGCTDPLRCCPKEQMVCYGDLDQGSICTCPGLWDCSANPTKCVQAKQIPGVGGWQCNWTNGGYSCSKSTADGKPPAGSNGWTCREDEASGSWICDKDFPPNPENSPAGAGKWTCSVDNGIDQTICTEKPAGTPQPPTPPAPQPPAGAGETNCADGVDNDGDGATDCQDSDCPACAPTTPPGPPGVTGPGGEICDGKDNNGNGQVDEGNVCQGVAEPCPPGAYQICDCYCGVHRKCLPDGTWGACIVDGDAGPFQQCKPAPITSHSQCLPGFVCDFGECVPFLKFNGECKKHVDCPVGQVCDLGKCVVDKYDPNKC